MDSGICPQRLTTPQPNRLLGELKPDEGEGRTRMNDNLEARKLGPAARRVVTAALVGALVAAPGVALAEQAAPVAGQAQDGTGSDAGDNDVELWPSAKKNVTVTDKDGQEVGSGYDTINAAVEAATDGATITINKTTSESANISKDGVTVTVAEGVEYKGTMTVSGKGVTVSGVRFVLDGTPGAAGGYTTTSLVLAGGMPHVTKCQFVIDHAADSVREGYTSILVRDTADGNGMSDVQEIEGNSFSIPKHRNGRTWLGIDVQGGTTPLERFEVYGNDVTVEASTDVTIGGKPLTKDSGDVVFLQAVGNAGADGYGIKNLKIRNTRVENLSGSSELVSIALVQGVDGLWFTGTVAGDVLVPLGSSGFPDQNPKVKGLLVGWNNFEDSERSYDLKPENLADGYLTYDGYDVSAPASAVFGASTYNGDGTWKVFPTASDAIKGAKNGDTVRLERASTEQIVVPAGKDVTVDLNGKQAAGVNVAPFKVEGKLTVTDSSDGTPGSVFNRNPAGDTFEVADGSSVEVKGGLFNKPLAEGLIADGSSNLSEDGRFKVVDVKVAEGMALGKVTTTDKDGKTTTVYFKTQEEADAYAKAQQAAGSAAIVAKDATVTYEDGLTYDASDLFGLSKGTKFGSYSIESDGTGAATLDGSRIFVTKAGTIRVKASASLDSGEAVEATATLTVTKAKATPEIRVTPDRLVGGGTVDIVVDRVPAGSSVTVTCDDADVKVESRGGNRYSAWLPNVDGTYGFTAKTSATDNYEAAASATATATVTHAPTGGNGGGGTVTPTPSGSAVTLPSATDGGKVASDKATAKAGETVTLTVTPDEGHRASKVRVTDEAGKKVKVAYADGKYTFTMPEGKVSVSVEFKANDARDFADNQANTWFKSAVEEMSAKGVMNGYGDGTYFGVGHVLTRSEFAALLHNWAQPGLADADDENETKLADVADGQFYTSAANWAVSNGIINGVSNPDGTRSFAPDQPVTLEQMCVIIGNLVDRDAASKADTSELAKYVDGAQVSPWAAHYVAWASKVGLFSGSVEGDGLHVRGGESIMRERVAGVLSNAFKNGILK